MKKDSKRSRHKNKGRQSKMRTRQNESSSLGRNTANSSSRNIILKDEGKQKHNKKKSTYVSKNNKIDRTKNKKQKHNTDDEDEFDDQDSGTSQSSIDNNENNDDVESEDEDDEEEEEENEEKEEDEEDGMNQNLKKRSSSSKNIIAKKQKNQSNEESEDSDESANDEAKNNNLSVLNRSAKTALQFYVRASLFQKIKIIGNEHLELNGQIIKEALLKTGFDPQKDNLHAFANACRRLIKRTISSKRSYIKKEIGDVFIDLVKRKIISLSMMDDMKKFYLPNMEKDPNVRYVWYILWYYFLPKVNPNWKSYLRENSIKKKELIYDYITTSDETVTLWYLDLWLPKVKEQHANNWPVVPKSSGEGDQESRTKKKEYAIIYKKINDVKKINKGELAFCWSNIFWEELTVRHPSMFKSEVSVKKNLNISNEENEEAIFLPDMDEENNDLKHYFNISQKTSVENNLYSFIAPSAKMDTPIDNTLDLAKGNKTNTNPSPSPTDTTYTIQDVMWPNDQNQIKENSEETDATLKDYEESNVAPTVTVNGQDITPVRV